MGSAGTLYHAATMDTSTRTALVVARDLSARRVAMQFVGVVGFALATALAAQLAIRLPHTPVPLTLQTAVVLMAGVAMGPGLGAASMALYLALGVAGHHVFALPTPGDWGLGYLFGPTGGYLLGFLLAQPVLGLLTRGAEGPGGRAAPGRLVRSAVAVLGGQAVIFACGLVWLGVWLGASPATTLEKGLFPFLAGGVVKCAIAVGCAPALLRWVRPLYR